MPRNGSGIYSLPAGNPVTSGTPISSTVQNNTTSDIATALTGSLASDGQTVPSADLPMGAYKHTNVANASARNHYAAAGQLQDSALTWAGTAGGTGDVITLTLTPSITAYAAGQSFTYKSGASPNTTAMTVNINSVGAKAIQKNGSALVAGNHPANSWFRITYDGAAFQLEQIAPTSAEVATSLALKAALAGQSTQDFSTKNLAVAGTLSVSGSITPSQTNGIVGTNTNNSANAGSIGEIISSTVLQASGVSLVTNTAKTITSITLTAGDWDLSGSVHFVGTATTTFNTLQGSSSLTTNSMDDMYGFYHVMANTTPGTIFNPGHAIPCRQVSISSSTTIYLTALCVFSTSTISAYGNIMARRAR